jgi:anti-sigma B factor antagonist
MFVQFNFRQLDPDVTVMDFSGNFSRPGIMVAKVEDTIRKRIEEGVRKLVLDLDKVDFIDSSGIGLLAVCSALMKQAGGRMAVTGAGGIAKQVLETVSVDRVIGVYPDLASACAAVSKPHSESAAR